jgi:eukaryotic-like serine/threonine-protein kinase
MVVEYLEGKDLAAWLRERGPLPIEQAVGFVLQACEAIAQAHALGIVHRDLKPANLLCVRQTDGRLRIKVVDFGVSKTSEFDGSQAIAMTSRRTVIGTPLYMSPEQMRSPETVDSRTDIWSFGILLFELITAQHPFPSRRNLGELFHCVISTPPTPIGQIRPEVPTGIEAVILRCLEKDRDRRYRDVAALALALLPFAPGSWSHWDSPAF